MILKRHKQRRFHSASPRRCLEFSLPRLGLELSASALPRLCLDKTALSSSLRFTCFRIYFIAQFYTDCAVTVTANFVVFIGLSARCIQSHTLTCISVTF